MRKEAAKTRFPVLLALVLVAAMVLPACRFSVELPPVDTPPAVDGRGRPLADYEDRLLRELARVVADPSLPPAERVVVSASPKVELVLIAAGLAGDWYFTSWVPSNDPRRSLQRSAAAHFSGHRTHHAVSALAELRLGYGFWYDALPHLALSFSDPPAFEQVYPISAYLAGRAGGDGAVLRELAVRLRDLALQADFAAWWELHEADYQAIEGDWRAAIAAADPLGNLETYFGRQLGALVIIPSGLVACGFGGSIEDPEGTWAVACIGPAAPGSPPDADFLEFMIYHEGGHSFVNPLADDYAELVSGYQKLYAPISAEMSAQAYNSWTIALNEHVLRACHARICLAAKGETEAEEMLAADEARGFRYVRTLFEKLAEYEADRDTYPDIGCFYPQLLSALDRYL